MGFQTGTIKYESIVTLFTVFQLQVISSYAFIASPGRHTHHTRHVPVVTMIR